MFLGQKRTCDATIQQGGGKKQKVASHETAYVPSIMQNMDILTADTEFSKAALRNIDTIMFDGRKLSHFFKCTEVLIKSSASRKTKTLDIFGQLINFDDTSDPDGLLQLVLTTVLEMLPSGKTDLIGFQLWGDQMEEPFYIPNRPREQNSPSVLLAEFNKLSQSARLVKLFHTALRFKVTVAQRRIAKGSARYDKKCLYEAVTNGLRFFFRTGDPDVETPLELWQTVSGIEKDGYAISDVEDIQTHILTTRQIRIVVLNEDNKVIFKGPRREREIFVQLKWNEERVADHYTFVPSPKKLFKKAQAFCADCDTPVLRQPHRRGCVATCPKCFRFGPAYPCPAIGSPLKCNDCGVTFFSKNCFDAHLETSSKKKRTICTSYTFCHTCQHSIPVRGTRTHACFKKNRQCGICFLQHPGDGEFCYVQPTAKKEPPNTVYCFFDAETVQDTGRHICNVIVAEFLCLACIKADAEPLSSVRPPDCYCQGVHTGRQIFTNFNGDNPVEKFLAYVTRKPLPGAKKYKILALAHNGGKFDFHLILQQLLWQNIKPKVTMQGLKIFNLSIEYNSLQHVVFKDTLNFLREKLAALPKTFGFQDDAEKAFFPHLFNTAANLDVRLESLPPVEYYAPDLMKSTDRTKFFTWYEQHKSTPFCLKEDLISYCVLDVVVLRKACLIFRQASIGLTGSDPFIVAGTLPKFALHTYRTNHLVNDALGHTPEKGYRKNEIQSEMALRFMRCYAEMNDVQVRTAEWANGEYKVPGTNFKVDGVIYDEDGKIAKALEYNGCYYHGCSDCYADHDKLVDGKTALELRLRDEERLQIIRNQMPVEVIWQCQFEAEMAHKPEIKEIYDSCNISPRMELRRDVLRGGRTEAFTYYYVPKSGETIKGADFVSMYPAVMKDCSYPLGHPTVLTRETFETDASLALNYNGFALVKILPPLDLYPVFLHYRTFDKRLVFGLCAACADGYDVECTHADSERAWIGGYTTVELKKAVELGYQIMETFEVWDYARWSKKGDECGLFDTYVDTFVREKVQNSGWGALTTAEEKRQCVEECERETGIRIDADAVVDNPGKRYCAKIMLNSLWGKLCQRNDLPQVIFTHNPDEFNAIMFDKRYEVTDFCHVSEKLDRICVRYKKGLAPETPYTSLAVACHVTAYGRMKLYDVMASVPGRLLYCDTDSIYYVEDQMDAPLETGRHLGALSVEYEGRCITKFVAGGPKNYGIRHTAMDGSDELAVLKVRGFQVNYKASKILVFDEVERAIIQQAQNGEEYEGLAVPYSLITRNKFAELQNKQIVKVYKPVYNKSICVENGLIIPFGTIRK
uniref:DNA-directed DNA polymerase n=1 Tax=Panagrellus redivivus TaxID=6233 RepID=A0A7E4VQI1_PANRE